MIFRTKYGLKERKYFSFFCPSISDEKLSLLQLEETTTRDIVKVQSCYLFHFIQLTLLFFA